MLQPAQLVKAVMGLLFEYTTARTTPVFAIQVTMMMEVMNFVNLVTTPAPHVLMPTLAQIVPRTDSPTEHTAHV